MTNENLEDELDNLREKVERLERYIEKLEDALNTNARYCEELFSDARGNFPIGFRVFDRVNGSL